MGLTSQLLCGLTSFGGLLIAIKLITHITIKQNINKAINVYIKMFVFSCGRLLVGVAVAVLEMIVVVLVDDITGPVKEYQ